MHAFRLICQVLFVIVQVAGFFMVLHQDVNGRTAKAPEGFVGVVSTVLIQAALMAMYWGAGFFDGWFR